MIAVTSPVIFRPPNGMRTRTPTWARCSSPKGTRYVNGWSMGSGTATSTNSGAEREKVMSG